MSFKMKGFPLQYDVYEYLDDGSKKKISYEEGVKKANRLKNIVFTGKDLIKALETNVLDEFKNDQEGRRKMIEKEKLKMKKEPPLKTRPMATDVPFGGEGGGGKKESKYTRFVKKEKAKYGKYDKDVGKGVAGGIVNTGSW